SLMETRGLGLSALRQNPKDLPEKLETSTSPTSSIPASLSQPGPKNPGACDAREHGKRRKTQELKIFCRGVTGRSPCRIFDVNRTVGIVTCVLWSAFLSAQSEKGPSYPFYRFDAARTHEIKPHRLTIPVKGVRSGSHQLRLRLTVSLTGEVLDSLAAGGD